MKRLPAYAIWAGFVRQDDASSLQDQLSRFLRNAIVSGALQPGARLPGSRELAGALNMSRNTVSLVFERLLTEGLLTSRRGSGTFVNESMARPSIDPHARTVARLSTRAETVIRGRPKMRSDARLALTPGLPDLQAFPFQTWSRLQGRYWRTKPTLSYSNSAGSHELRAAIAAYIGATRGISCQAEHLLITSGTQGAVLACALALAEPGDKAWVENPGYAMSSRALALAGLTPVPVAVDEFGLDVSAGEKIASDARIAMVTPSHQYPLGSTLSLTRRLALIDWANRANAWIIEDDYDGEYRYDGTSVQALKTLDRDNRVIYVGTLSKLLGPGLRLGFMIVPDALIEPLTEVRATIDQGVASPAQAVCAAFISDGHLAAHIRRTKINYRDRRDIVCKTLSHWPQLEKITGASAGLHLVAHLNGLDDQQLALAARDHGIGVNALSSYALGRTSQPLSGVLIGYANTATNQIALSLNTLAELIASMRGRSG